MIGMSYFLLMALDTRRGFRQWLIFTIFFSPLELVMAAWTDAVDRKRGNVCRFSRLGIVFKCKFILMLGFRLFDIAALGTHDGERVQVSRMSKFNDGESRWETQRVGKLIGCAVGLNTSSLETPRMDPSMDPRRRETSQSASQPGMERTKYKYI